MPRRWLSPDFFTDEKMKRATVPERLLAAAIIANQDDDGRLRGDPAYLRSIAFLYDDYALNEVREMRDHLAEANPNILVYQNDGDEYIQLKQYAKYQKPRYYWPSRFPALPGWQPAPRQTPIVIPESGLQRTVKEMLLSGQLLLNGERATSVHEQERVGNSYIDILAEDSKGNRHIIELKRSALLNKHREQVCDYVNKYCDKFRLDVNTGNLTKTLIGTALSPNFSTSEAQKNNVNVLTIDRNMNLLQLVNITVTFTGNSTVAPRDRDRDRDKDLNKDLDKGKGEGPKRHPPPSPSTQLEIYDKFVECFEKGWGLKPTGKVLAQIRDFSQELSAAGCPVAYVQEAFREAADANKLYLVYVRGMLLDWLGVPRAPPE